MCEAILMEFHEICNIFPMMSEEEYRQLVQDIKANGLREPIWTYQGKIIDGRNRYLACMELGIEPRYREWDGQGSLVQFVVSLNLHRRHLTSSQKAVIALEIEKWLAKEAEERKRELCRQAALRQHHGSERVPQIVGEPSRRDPHEGEASFKSATLVGTNRQYVSDAKRLAKESPEVLERVRQGKLTIPEAKNIVALPAEMRTIVLEKLDRGEAKTVKEAKKLAYQEVRAKDKKAPAESDAYRLICGELSAVETQIPDESIDAIITDPPYPKEYLGTFEVLARVAARVLKPGGSLLTLVPHQWLPQILERMTKYLHYHWTLAYVQPGETARIWGSRIIVGWKPVLWFTKGTYAGDFVYDVVESDRRDKEHHEWGQSEGGITTLVERFTLPGQLVLDPFVGGGTTAVVAVRLGRRFIGVDIDPKAIDETRRRLAELATP
jgi:site-specific DNA-methyltransferase (adenine-specific)